LDDPGPGSPGVSGNSKKGVQMAVLGKTIESQQELFVDKLGAALTMEETILDMLEKLQQEARDASLRRNLQQHHKQTQGHVRNLRQVFTSLGEKPEKQPCPAIEGLQKEGEQLRGRVDEPLVDSVILGGVIETEHHEIAVYDGLIIQAERMGDDDVIALLNENIEEEEATLKKAISAAEQLAKKTVRQTA
jgi:ferritin-like metal-binding protein YciE